MTGRQAEQDRLLAELAELVRTDPLTGAANRRSFAERFAAETLRAARHDRPLGVAVLDLDDFKALNDLEGHGAGDRLLVEAAGAWRGTLRTEDLLARLGGDEFAVLLPDCPAEHLATVAERLCALVPGDVTCSIGTTLHRPGDGLEATLARADAKLYAAKHERTPARA